MEITPIALGAVVSALLGVAVGGVKALIDVKTLKEKERFLKDATRRVAEVGLSLAGISVSLSTEERSSPDSALAKELLREIQSEIAAQATSISQASGKAVDDQVETKLSDLKERLEAVEARFPDKSSIDKIASINDALFAERIDQLATRIDNIENKLLSKWDVAITVSLVLSGIFVVVGGTYAVLKTFGLLAPGAA